MQGVEPSAGLSDVLNDEVAGVVVLEPFLVFKGVVRGSERHGARFKPAVKNFGDAAHHRFPARVVRVRAYQSVDSGAVQVDVLNRDAEVL